MLMKKLLTILAAATLFTACGNSSESTTKTDSVVTTTDTMKPAMADSTMKMDSSKMMTDTMKSKMTVTKDTTKMKK